MFYQCCRFNNLFNVLLTGTGATGYTYAFSFPSRPASLSQFPPYFTVTNLASQSVSVCIIFSAGDFYDSSVLEVDTYKTFELPTSVFLPASNGVSNKTVVVCSSGPVSLYGFVAESKNDAMMLDDFMELEPWDRTIRGTFLGVSAISLGTEYHIPAYPRDGDFTTVFTLSAVEDDTNVNISFTADTTPPGRRSFALQSGQSYQVLVKQEVILSTIESDKPVSVLTASKSESNEVFLLKQMMPQQSFGTDYVLTPFEGSYYDYCVVATEATTITRHRITMASQDTQNSVTDNLEVNGVSCEQNVPVDEYLMITSNDPVAVYQYVKGYSETSSNAVSLAMIIVPPLTSYLSSDATYSVIGDGNVDISMYIISNTNTSFNVNGELQPVFRQTQVEDTFVYRTTVSSSGKHVIAPTTSDDDVEFMVIIYGGQHADGTVASTTTTMSPDDGEGSGSGDLVEEEAGTTTPSVDVVHGRFQSLFAYPVGVKMDTNGI